MKNSLKISGIVGFILYLVFHSQVSAIPEIQPMGNLKSMPLAFTENQGQWDEEVLFRADASGATIWITVDDVVYRFTRRITGNEVVTDDQIGRHLERFDFRPDSLEHFVIKAKFIGSNPNPRVVGEDLMAYRCNYFIGNDPAKWRTDVPNYRAIVIHGIFPGVDLRFGGNTASELNYQYLLAPGVDGSQIGIEYEVPDGILVDEAGRLTAGNGWGEIPGLLTTPGDNFATFSNFISSNPTVSTGVTNGVSEYGYSRGMTLEYSTFLGGNDTDRGNAIAVDGSGCAYVTGETLSSNFPDTNACVDTLSGNYDAFVTKFSAAGDSLLYSTYLGGSGVDRGHGIAVDDLDCAYITGYTESSEITFPLVDAPYYIYRGNGDAFVTKLSAAGDSLRFSTYWNNPTAVCGIYLWG